MTDFDTFRARMPKEIGDLLYAARVENKLSKDDPLCTILAAMACFHQGVKRREERLARRMAILAMIIAVPLSIWLGYALKPTVYAAPDGHFSNATLPDATTAVCFTPSHGRVNKVWARDGRIYITLAPQ